MFWGTGQGLLLMLPSTGHKDFLCFYGRGHEYFLEKISNYICVISQGGDSHRLGYEMCYF